MKANITVNERQSIATFNNVPAVRENSFIYEVFGQAASSGICIDMIAQSPPTSDKISFGFTFSDDDMPKILTIIKNCENSDIPAPLVNVGNAKITVKSEDMIESSGFAGKVFEVLKNLNCLPLLVTTGIDEISLLVGQSDKENLEHEFRLVFC